MITAVNQINILQLSLQFKASRVAVAAVIFGDVFWWGKATATTSGKHHKVIYNAQYYNFQIFLTTTTANNHPAGNL